MLRLNQADFEDPHELAKYAATCGISLDEFRSQFYYLIESDILYKNLKDGKIKLTSPEVNDAHKPLSSTQFKEVKGENGSMLP